MPNTVRQVAQSDASGLALSNRAVRALVDGSKAVRIGGGVVHPTLARLALNRREYTRDELLAAYRQDLRDAEADPSKWKDVALRLNGFNEADIVRLAAALSIHQLNETKSAVETYLAGWPAQQTILSALAKGGRGHGKQLRPQTSAFWAQYQHIGYNVFRGESATHQVWALIGGNVGQYFDGQNTCASRVSWALNRSGMPIRDGILFRNDRSVTFEGTPGDGLNYIVGAAAMATFLRRHWGEPDATLQDNRAARDFQNSLRPGRGAIFAGRHHSGFIMQGYDDAYIYGDPGVMPIEVWLLPSPRRRPVCLD